jgi:hypothetical protein
MRKVTNIAGHVTTAIAVLLGTFTACRKAKPLENYYEPPSEVVASFNRLADSVTPELYMLLDSAGFHRGWSDTSSRASTPDVHVREQSEAEARAKVYEADLSLTLHTHDVGMRGYPMRENLFLEFVSIGGAKWALLTDKGYPFTFVTESNRNDLPLDLEQGVRQVFRTRIEFSDWAAYRLYKVDNPPKSATSH